MVFLKNKGGRISLINNEWDSCAPKGIIIENAKGKEQTRIVLNENGSSISCGVTEVTNLPKNTAMNYVIGVIKETAKTELEQKEILALLFKKAFRRVPGKFILFSDNDSKTRSIIHETLSDICDYETKWATNPNSGNKIKIWTYLKRV